MPFRADVVLDDGTRLSYFFVLKDIQLYMKKYREKTAPKRKTTPLLPWLVDMSMLVAKPHLENRRIEKLVIRDKQRG